MIGTIFGILFFVCIFLLLLWPVIPTTRQRMADSMADGYEEIFNMALSHGALLYLHNTNNTFSPSAHDPETMAICKKYCEDFELLMDNNKWKFYEVIFDSFSVNRGDRICIAKGACKTAIDFYSEYCEREERYRSSIELLTFGEQ